MKKLTIALISAFAVCLSLAACKSNTDDKPENSQQNSPSPSSAVIENSVITEEDRDDSRQDEAENGVITDDNGLIGDGDDKDNTLSDIVDDAASGAESIADNAREGLQSAGEDMRNGAENAAEGIRDGISDAVTDDDDDNRDDDDDDDDHDHDNDNNTESSQNNTD